MVIFSPFIHLLILGKVIFWGTASLQFIPWYQYFFDSILDGNFPLWNPYNGLGVPFLANHQSAVFYPLNWILFIFYLLDDLSGLSKGLTLLLPVHLAIAGLGMMQILAIYQKSKFSQLMAGITFAFCGYILTRLSFISMVWAFAWLPWIIIASIQIGPFPNKKTIPQILRLGLLVAVQILAGHAQTSFYTMLIAVVVVCFANFQSFLVQIRKAISFIIAVFISVVLSAIQIIPTAELLMNSQRSSEVGYDFAVSLSLWPARLLIILFGNFWGNPNYGRFLSGGNFWEENIYAGVFPVVIVLVLLWILVWKTRKRQISADDKKKIIFWLIILVFSILYSFGKFFPLFPFLYNYIPGFSLFQAPVRFLLIYFFALSILFGFGLDAWIFSQFNRKKTVIILVVFGTIVTFSIYGKFSNSYLPDELLDSILLGGGLGFLFGILTLIKDKTSINITYIKIVIVVHAVSE